MTLPWTYLQDDLTEWEGWKIYGTPWQPWFCDWAFNLREPELKGRWDLIPTGVDILLLHGPPYGYGDAVARRSGAEVVVEHTGSPGLLARIQELAPRLVVFGHIHEGRGEWRLGETIFANVTQMDASFRPVYPPWVCELPSR
jgi:hypothetical protein